MPEPIFALEGEGALFAFEALGELLGGLLRDQAEFRQIVGAIHGHAILRDGHGKARGHPWTALAGSGLEGWVVPESHRLVMAVSLHRNQTGFADGVDHLAFRLKLRG